MLCFKVGAEKKGILKMRKVKETYKYQNDKIVGVEGEEDYKTFDFDRFDWRVVITKTINDSYGESYFNVYIIDEDFRIEPLNNLDENIPLENEPKDWNEYLLRRLCERYVWKKLDYNVGISDIEDNRI
jgi:hypothetical protein